MVGTKYNSMLSTRNLTLSDLKYLVLVALLQSGPWDVSLLVVLVEEIVGQEEQQQGEGEIRKQSWRGDGDRKLLPMP